MKFTLRIFVCAMTICTDMVGAAEGKGRELIDLDGFFGVEQPDTDVISGRTGGQPLSSPRPSPYPTPFPSPRSIPVPAPQTTVNNEYGYQEPNYGYGYQQPYPYPYPYNYPYPYYPAPPDEPKVEPRTPQPTHVPTPNPTPLPTMEPTPNPSPRPTPVPTPIPTMMPTPRQPVIPPVVPPPPSESPTGYPSPAPSPEPSPSPTASPSANPSPEPTPAPSPAPSPGPTPEPSISQSPTTGEPSSEPSENPTQSAEPSENPTQSAEPSENPTQSAEPSENPTQSAEPSEEPTLSAEPSESPTIFNSFPPTIDDLPTIFGIICDPRNENIFGTLCEIIQVVPGLERFLDTPNPFPNRKLQSDIGYTFFAPTNNAFKRLQLPFSIDILGGDLSPEEVNFVRFVLLYHLNSKVYTFNGLTCNRMYTMFNGVRTQTRCRDNDRGIEVKFQIGTSSSAFGGGMDTVVVPSDSPRLVKEPRDVLASNGIIHAINNVILPDLSIYETNPTAAPTT